MQPAAGRPPPPGVWVPSLVFFHPEPSDDTDYATTSEHLLRLARSGVDGILIHGSNGEAMHLSSAERTALICHARSLLNEHGFGHVPLMAGTGAESLRETVQLTHEAAQAGAEWVLVLPPSFWRDAMMAGNKERLKDWYLDVASRSTVPVLVYNFPAVRAGVDVGDEIMVEVARSSQESSGGGRGTPIVGAKLSDANIGKLNRLGAAFAPVQRPTRPTGQLPSSGPVRLPLAHAVQEPEPSADSALTETPESDRHAKDMAFHAYVGRSDAFLNSVLGGGCAGVIGALVNFAPRTHARIWTLVKRGKGAGREARTLQALLARGDGEIGRVGGVAGLKAGVAAWWGYGRTKTREGRDEDGKEDVEAIAVVRKPLKSMKVDAARKGTLGHVLQDLKEVEDRLEELVDKKGIENEKVDEEFAQWVVDKLVVPWAPWEE